MKSVIAQNLYVSKLPSELPKSRGAFKIDLTACLLHRAYKIRNYHAIHQLCSVPQCVAHLPPVQAGKDGLWSLMTRQKDLQLIEAHSIFEAHWLEDVTARSFGDAMKSRILGWQTINGHFRT